MPKHNIDKILELYKKKKTFISAVQMPQLKEAIGFIIDYVQGRNAYYLCFVENPPKPTSVNIRGVEIKGIEYIRFRIDDTLLNSEKFQNLPIPCKAKIYFPPYSRTVVNIEPIETESEKVMVELLGHVADKIELVSILVVKREVGVMPQFGRLGIVGTELVSKLMEEQGINEITIDAIVGVDVLTKSSRPMILIIPAPPQELIEEEQGGEESA